MDDEDEDEQQSEEQKLRDLIETAEAFGLRQAAEEARAKLELLESKPKSNNNWLCKATAIQNISRYNWNFSFCTTTAC